MSSQTTKRYGSAFGRPSGSGSNAGFGTEPSNPLRGESFAEPDVFSGTSSSSELPVEKLQNEADASAQASSFSESLSFERSQPEARDYATEEPQSYDSYTDYGASEQAYDAPQDSGDLQGYAAQTYTAQNHTDTGYDAQSYDTQSYDQQGYESSGYEAQSYDQQPYTSAADNSLIDGYDQPAQDEYQPASSSSFGSSFGSSASSFGSTSTDSSSASGWRSRFRSTSTGSSFGSAASSDFGSASSTSNFEATETYGSSTGFGASNEAAASYGSSFDAPAGGEATDYRADYNPDESPAVDSYEQVAAEESYQSPSEGFFSSFMSRFGAWLWPLLILLVIASVIFMVFMWFTGSSSGIDLNSPQTIDSVKRMLEVITIPAGELNGEADDDFRSAIRTFQEWYGYPQTGELTEDLITDMQEMINVAQ